MRCMLGAPGKAFIHNVKQWRLTAAVIQFTFAVVLNVFCVVEDFKPQTIDELMTCTRDTTNQFGGHAVCIMKIEITAGHVRLRSSEKQTK